MEADETADGEFTMVDNGGGQSPTLSADVLEGTCNRETQLVLWIAKINSGLCVSKQELSISDFLIKSQMASPL